MTTRRTILGALAALFAVPTFANAISTSGDDLGIPHIPETGVEHYEGRHPLQLLADGDIGGCRLLPEIDGYPCYLERSPEQGGTRVIGVVVSRNAAFDCEGRFSSKLPQFEACFRKYSKREREKIWERELAYQYAKKVEAIKKFEASEMYANAALGMGRPGAWTPALSHVEAGRFAGIKLRKT